MALLPISHLSLRTLMQRRRLIADAMQHITVHQKKLFQLPEEARPCLTKYCKYTLVSGQLYFLLILVSGQVQ